MAEGARRYVYAPRMSPAELSTAMNDLDLTAWHLSWLTGISAKRIRRMLTGEPGFDVPVILHSALWVWQRDHAALRLASDFARAHTEG